MKKLLSALSAIGLVASTGSSLVSCGSSDDSKKSDKLEENSKVTVSVNDKASDNVKKELTGTWTTTVVKASSNLEIALSADEKAKDLNDILKDTKIDTNMTKENAEDVVLKAVQQLFKDVKSSDLSFNYEAAPVVKKDIKDVKVSVKAGQTLEDVKKAINAEIVKIAKDAKEATDYTVTPAEGAFDKDNKAVEGKTIEVKAKDDSKLITGKFTVTVEKAA